MEIEGTIQNILQTKVVSEKFKSRDLWLKIDEQSQYPQIIAVQFAQDKCAILDKFAVGQKVKIGINLRGREWVNPKTNETIVFNTIQGWKIEAVGGQAVPAAPANEYNVNTPSLAVQAAEALSDLTGDDDLPF